MRRMYRSAGAADSLLQYVYRSAGAANAANQARHQNASIIEMEKIGIVLELNATDFIDGQISDHENISGIEKENTIDEFLNDIQISAVKSIRAKSIMFVGSGANEVFTCKSADTFRGGTKSYCLKSLTQTNM